MPATHAMPPPHWLFAVHAVHVPPMQARPCSGCGFWDGWLQSLKHQRHLRRLPDCGTVAPTTVNLPCGAELGDGGPCAEGGTTLDSGAAH